MLKIEYANITADNKTRTRYATPAEQLPCENLIALMIPKANNEKIPQTQKHNAVTFLPESSGSRINFLIDCVFMA